MDKNTLNRHDLLFINEEAVICAGAGADCTLKNTPQIYYDEMFGETNLRFPAIVCRQKRSLHGFIDVGFSSHRRIDGVRCRFSSFIPLTGIEKVMTPFHVMQYALKKSHPPEVMCELMGITKRYGVRIGLLGSYAMQAVTGLPYTTQESDMDIILQGDVGELRVMGNELLKLEQEFKIGIDAEVRLAQGYDIKLKEMLLSKRTILGKSLDSVALLIQDNDSFFEEESHIAYIVD